MAPPDRDDYPRGEGVGVLENLQLHKDADSRLTHNAGRLASWVEWLLHPEEHDYDRTVTYSDGTKREEPQRVTKANPAPGHYDPIDLPFESVIAHFSLEQFLDGMAAFATQQVERPSSVLAPAAAAMKNVWWVGDMRMMELVGKKPTEDQWSGAAADKARTFIDEMSTAVNQLNKIADEFTDMVPRYALIVKTPGTTWTARRQMRSRRSRRSSASGLPTSQSTSRASCLPRSSRVRLPTPPAARHCR